MKLKTVLIFAVGVVAGSAATFVFLGNRMKRKLDRLEEECEERTEREIASVKEAYHRRAAAKEKADRNEQAKKDLMTKEKEPETVKGFDEKAVLKELKQSKDLDRRAVEKDREEAMQYRQRYNRNVFEMYDTEEVPREDAGDEEDIQDEPPTEGLAEEPYVISFDAFFQEKRHYDKVTIYLYKDDVAVDDDERTLDDLDALVGAETVRKAAELADDDNNIFVRNEMRSTDYEIVLMNETYIPDTAPVRDD